MSVVGSLDLIGEKVIVQSNNNPCMVGVLTRWEGIRDNKEFPVVVVDDTEWVCMGVVLPYSEEMFNLLSGLTVKRAWEMCRDISITIQIVKRKGNGK